MTPECSHDGKSSSEAERGHSTQRRTVCATSYSDSSTLTSARLGHNRTCARSLPCTATTHKASGTQRARGSVLCALWNGHAPEVRWRTHAIGRRASRGSAPQPKINHTAYRRGEETGPPASKQRNQQGQSRRHTPPIRAYRLCTLAAAAPCVLPARERRLGCALGACTGRGRGYKDDGDEATDSTSLRLSSSLTLSSVSLYVRHRPPPHQSTSTVWACLSPSGPLR